MTQTYHFDEKNMTLDVIIAIMQANLASKMGSTVTPDLIKDLCGVIQSDIRHNQITQPIP